TNTILCQVAAETLGVPYECTYIHQPDTRLVPNSGPTVASRTAMIVGKLVQRACEQILEKLRAEAHLPTPHTYKDYRRAAILYGEEVGELEVSVRYESPEGIFWDDDTYSGEAYPAYAWAVHVAEVAVDTTTYSAT